jgi:hypothetical protein
MQRLSYPFRNSDSGAFKNKFYLGRIAIYITILLSAQRDRSIFLCKQLHAFNRMFFVSLYVTFNVKPDRQLLIYSLLAYNYDVVQTCPIITVIAFLL